MSSHFGELDNETHKVTISTEEMFYLFSELNVALKMAVSLPSPVALETGQSEGYLLRFSSFNKMELEIFLKDLSSKYHL